MIKFSPCCDCLRLNCFAHRLRRRDELVQVLLLWNKQFDTNDKGISRDDVGAFIPLYLEQGVLLKEPWKTIDEDGFGWLVRLSSAEAEGRSSNLNLSVSVCGEHGEDPESIKFFDSVGLNYVSCSLFPFPVARLVKTQVTILRQKNNTDPQEKRASGFVPKI
ncbi:unnamed protein product [Cylindrotheca closterium]|uniref:PEP-utilising enzyme C-terminal domain-containing protein n=1 Tax=Cylindrotheca closterium TaxID=2856 RepID=A0AAD2PXU6_9STRA|nr:unnamed protein product [Cylindrotheca closterium]